jgi:hypothetical protein
LKQAMRGVYDSRTGVDYDSDVQTAALLRSPLEDDVAPLLADVAAQPRRFYRSINVFAWLSVIGAGSIGWLIVFRLF